MQDITRYSKSIPGTRRNYHMPVKFDMTDSFLGISQTDRETNTIERVLLSGAQVKALLRFVKKGVA